jgi:protein O-GlcNAc transferase
VPRQRQLADRETNVQPARIIYKRCPLCDGQSIATLHDASCDWHALYKPGLPATMRWMRCSSCNHTFVDGYFTADALRLLFSDTHASQTPGHDAEAQRFVWAPTVEKVTAHLSGPLGGWLDVGLGNGSLLFTAKEWGYHPVGLDLRPTTIEEMRALGYEAYCCDLTDHNAGAAYQVVSMCDVLEHLPFPKRALEHVHRLLRPDGILLLSMPNLDSEVWSMLDRAGTNPYWGELEHYHNFGRERLVALLDETGFDFVHYAVSARWRVTMEIVARRRTRPAAS